SPASIWEPLSRSGPPAINSTSFCAAKKLRPSRRNMDLLPTPSQTVGPFFHLGLTADARSVACMASSKAKGERVWLCCRVFDSEGVPLNDAMIELWQADAEGRYRSGREDTSADAECPGFGRLATTEEGCCDFETIKPGRVLGPDDVRQAPHIE